MRTVNYIVGSFRLVFLFAAVLSVCIVNASCTAPRTDALPPTVVVSSEEDDFIITYNVNIDIDPETRFVSGVQKVRFKNTAETPLTDVCFSLNLNAFRRGVRPKPYFSEFEERIFRNGQDFGYIDIQNVTVNRESLIYETFRSSLRITLAEELPPGDETEVALQFEAYIPEIYHRTGANEYAVWMGSFLPTLCVYDANGWNTGTYYAAGTPFFSQIANYNVTINTPPHYTVAATGVEDIAESEDARQTVINVRLVRDFAFSVSNYYIRTIHTAQSGVEINVYTYSPEADAEAYCIMAERALEYFGSVISGYPYRQFDIAEVGLFSPMNAAYPQLIFMDSDFMFSGAALYDLPKQIARQWFGNITGSNPVSEAWLSEGIVWLLGDMLLYDEAELDAKMRRDYDNLAKSLSSAESEASLLSAGLETYTSWDDYTAVQCVRAELMMYGLKLKMGEELFIGFLKQYYTEYAYAIATGEDFIRSAGEAAGEDLTDFFDAWINGKTLPPL